MSLRSLDPAVQEVVLAAGDFQYVNNDPWAAKFYEVTDKEKPEVNRMEPEDDKWKQAQADFQAALKNYYS